MSLEIVAQAKTIAVTKSANATSAGRVVAVGATTSTSSDAQSTIERIPTPEIGLFEAPMSPAMYPQMPAIRKPTSSTNGTASSVSRQASGARAVDRANVNASQPATAAQPTVKTRIHGGEISRSRSSLDAVAREAARVLTRPPRTGLASVARV